MAVFYDLKFIWELMGANSMGFENVGEFGSPHHFEMPFADHIILNTVDGLISIRKPCQREEQSPRFSKARTS